MIPDGIQKLIVERDTVLVELGEAEKEFIRLQKKEKALSTKIEGAWVLQTQKIMEVLCVKG